MFQGWIPNPAAVEAVLGSLALPFLGDAAPHLADSGKGKTSFPFKAVEAVAGSFPNYPAQETGDCVSHAYRTCIDVLKAVEIANGEDESWEAETATEPIYAGARVEIGGGRIRGGGCVGAWAAKWINEYGVLLRRVYGGYDLTRYSGERADSWGNRGCPGSLTEASREHPIKTVSLVETYEAARDAIFQGYPVAVCSYQGFSSRRDNEGFASPRGTWAHAMAFIGMDDAHSRPGLLCQNSWGPNWIDGPTRHGQPAGSFWVDADTANRMLRQGDSFALSGFEGYPSRELPDYLKI